MPSDVYDFAGLDRELDTVSCEHHDDAEIVGKARAALRAADEMERELERYKNLAREVTCVWCGFQFESTLQSQAEHLYEHAKVCEKHPVQKAQAELARQKQLLETTVRDQCETEDDIERTVAAQIGPRQSIPEFTEPIDAFVERGMAELGRLRAERDEALQVDGGESTLRDLANECGRARMNEANLEAELGRLRERVAELERQLADLADDAIDPTSTVRFQPPTPAASEPRGAK